MISICIPTYNYDVRPLVNELLKQVVDLNFEVEILVVDDCSTDLELKADNKLIQLLSAVRLIELETNIGRSAIRNLLSKEAKFNLLLFLDCDVYPENQYFIAEYFNNRLENGVVVGGLVYRMELPDSNFSLRWNYGHQRESLSVEQRNRNPYGSFMTGNFMISKSVFSKILFDEKLKGYGHEDTFFGILLQQKNIEIRHIENRVYHDGLETNAIFIKKTEQGIDNLLRIYLSNPSNSLFISKNRLLKTFVSIRKLKLTWFFAVWFRISQNRLLANLTSKKPGIRTFDWYKLGYLCFISIKS